MLEFIARAAVLVKLVKLWPDQFFNSIQISIFLGPFCSYQMLSPNFGEFRLGKPQSIYQYPKHQTYRGESTIIGVILIDHVVHEQTIIISTKNI